jgi:cellulose synthase/poly-beta-1,6-N-acetylglucosamine synthase-like glycosyltransferase/glycosyltransferase involved in cell wall biosynthesis
MHLPAILTKLRDKWFSAPIHVLNNSLPGMLGSGVNFRKNSYITHTTLHHTKSAMSTFVSWQITLISSLILAVTAGFVYAPLVTAITLVAILSAIYLVDVFFNLFVIMKSLHIPPEITVTGDKIALLDYLDLPVYSILCPLYKEAHVLPQFVAAMEGMDWPKEKLEVMLLLEEDDQVTIDVAQKMKLPSNFRIVIVPDSKPKTKPKACNYGLGMAKGEYIVVYDAEDQPDPLQLKQAYYAFRELSKKVVCLQAKLNYYNPTHNLLTRLFTAEYSLWFDVILPGLQSIGTSIPLGGTSNHFRTNDLRNLEGWDPFNVTEDCDLGARIFKAGYQTAIIDSTTLEEANSNVKNWFRQRSRWLKGYMQTYLVHMRHPLSFMRSHGVHSLIFQLIVGGRIAFILINPLLWALTIAYFVLYAQLGPSIEAIFPGIIFYMAVTSLLLGNFTYLYNYMIGCAKRGHWNLIKYVFLIPIYWLMISYAATIALFQLFFKPHYWEKTIHGLHLDHADKLAASKLTRSARGVKFQKYADLATSAWNAGGVMVVAALFGNVMNFLYNAYLGRHLNLEEFGEISLFGSLLYLASVPISALGRSITHTSAYLYGKYDSPVKNLWSHLRPRILRISLTVSLFWIISIPLLQRFFHIDSWYPFLLFTPVWVVATLNSFDGGFLGGSLFFGTIALAGVLEATSKFGFSALFVYLGLSEYVYAALPLSILISLALVYLVARRIKLTHKNEVNAPSELHLSTKFYLTSILSNLASVSYLTIDILLAKHYLSPADAGAYSYLSLAGKMVFFLGGMFSQLLVPYLSRDLGAGKHPYRSFIRIFGLVALANMVAVLVFGVFGYLTAPFLWGSKATQIIPYLPIYSLSMALFSFTSIIINYQQIRQRYIFPILGFLLGALQVIGMLYVHGSIYSLVEIVFATSLVSLTVVVILSRFYGFFVDLLHLYLDFIGLFKPLSPTAPIGGGKLRILIFNWRDLRHKWAGGAEVYLHELSKRWVKMGHQVTIFAGNDGHSARFEKYEGVRLVRRGGFYLVYLWAFLYYSFRLRGRYDVIIDSENGLPFFTPLYAKEKIFLLIHHVHQEVFRKSLVPPFSWLAQFLEKRVMPLVYRKTEVLTVSPSSKADIIAHKLTRRDPHVVYNGVDLGVCKPGVKSKFPTILYLGRLTTAKSVNILIMAVKKIMEKVPQVQVFIAGDGPSRKSLEKLVKSLKLEAFITFTGKVSEREKLSLYQQAWVFVNPSLIEGWGITTIEANACGTPVVASNVAGLRDAVHNPHSGFLVPYGNVDEFAKSITKLLINPTLRHRMSRESITWARKFEWHKSADECIYHLTRKLNI